jgi:hypothetical protein
MFALQWVWPGVVTFFQETQSPTFGALRQIQNWNESIYFPFPNGYPPQSWQTCFYVQSVQSLGPIVFTFLLIVLIALCAYFFLQLFYFLVMFLISAFFLFATPVADLSSSSDDSITGGSAAQTNRGSNTRVLEEMQNNTNATPLQEEEEEELELEREGGNPNGSGIAMYASLSRFSGARVPAQQASPSRMERGSAATAIRGPIATAYPSTTTGLLGKTLGGFSSTVLGMAHKLVETSGKDKSE